MSPSRSMGSQFVDRGEQEGGEGGGGEEGRRRGGREEGGVQERVGGWVHRRRVVRRGRVSLGGLDTTFAFRLCRPPAQVSSLHLGMGATS